MAACSSLWWGSGGATAGEATPGVGTAPGGRNAKRRAARCRDQGLLDTAYRRAVVLQAKCTGLKARVSELDAALGRGSADEQLVSIQVNRAVVGRLLAIQPCLLAQAASTWASGCNVHSSRNVVDSETHLRNVAAKHVFDCEPDGLTPKQIRSRARGGKSRRALLAARSWSSDAPSFQATSSDASTSVWEVLTSWRPLYAAAVDDGDTTASEGADSRPCDASTGAGHVGAGRSFGVDDSTEHNADSLDEGGR